MMKNLLFLLLLLFGSMPLQAQIETINLDIVTGKLNGTNPIPAEKEFYIQGSIPEKIEMVKLTIYPSKKTEKAGYSYFWKSPFGYKELSYQVLVSNPLRSSQNYYLEFGFYQKAGKDQIDEVTRLISQNIESYLSTITTIKRGGIKFSESNEVILSNLEQILEKGSYYFELPNGEKFPGFSDISRAKLEQREKLKMGKAKYNATQVGENDNARAIYAAQYLAELNEILTAEIAQYLSPNMLVRVDEKIFRNYPTEKTANLIPINIGYGAISLSKGLPDQEFTHSPYVGFSFPLGNRTFARFMNNLSISSGVFISGNMENALNERISGPIDRPIYVGLGYNFFRVIRLNAGGTFITTEQLGGMNVDSFQPFVGLSAEFNLWLGFGKKK
ncbi:hypothetical protein [Algoriphagus marinus]|uniref:hypothetical protein n=1 Tax=Algoriphagus marinus TaxID=1925762 RepID=UPI0009F9A645|nr:hypothetical protein [Algoriphagus marinus]